MQDSHSEPSREEVERLVDRVEEALRQLAPLFPDVDPGDLLLILQSLLRPPGWGRYFLLKRLDSGGFAL